MAQNVIRSVDPGSPAARAHILPGEQLCAVDGHSISDVLDYKFYTYDSRFWLTVRSAEGKERMIRIHKAEGEELGLNFDTYLMDKPRPCANHCVFCFVDQLPKGLRSTLYFKDDDARLSFLLGNYITLTNLSEREVQRICDLHISPINVSVHATDPELRKLLLGNRNAGRGLELMRRLAQAHIVMNCQVVACPGLNDGAALEQTMRDLEALWPAVNSVSVVPVGLTKYREGLYPLEPYTEQRAGETVDQVEAFGERCLQDHGTRIFWCSDEFYLKARRPIPEDGFYEAYTQLENGVGMLRLLETEFCSALKLADRQIGCPACTVATGVSAAPWIQMLADKAAAAGHGVNCTVVPIVNHFFGETIDVAGLVTGGDLIDQLRGRELGQRLLIPENMLRHGEHCFLDDVTVEDVEQALGLPVVIVPQDGMALCDAILGIE